MAGVGDNVWVIGEKKQIGLFFFEVLCEMVDGDEGREEWLLMFS